MLKPNLFVGLAALGVLAACSGSAPEPGSVGPAGQVERAAFGEGPGDKFKPVEDAAVKELFCVNALGGACPADIDDRLETYASGSTGSRIDLTDSFVLLAAAEDADEADAEIDDASYVEACYKVILGRDSDPGGYSANLDFVSRTGGRKTLIESMLRSEEFRS